MFVTDSRLACAKAQVCAALVAMLRREQPCCIALQRKNQRPDLAPGPPMSVVAANLGRQTAALYLNGRPNFNKIPNRSKRAMVGVEPLHHAADLRINIKNRAAFASPNNGVLDADRL